MENLEDFIEQHKALMEMASRTPKVTSFTKTRIKTLAVSMDSVIEKYERKFEKLFAEQKILLRRMERLAQYVETELEK